MGAATAKTEVDLSDLEMSELQRGRQPHPPPPVLGAAPGTELAGILLGGPAPAHTAAIGSGLRWNLPESTVPPPTGLQLGMS